MLLRESTDQPKQGSSPKPEPDHHHHDPHASPNPRLTTHPHHSPRRASQALPLPEPLPGIPTDERAPTADSTTSGLRARASGKRCAKIAASPRAVRAHYPRIPRAHTSTRTELVLRCGL
eukprot:5019357-Prymnesium_polylepis.2